MRVEAKHRKTDHQVTGTLVEAQKAMSKNQYKSLGLHARELVILEDRATFPFYGNAYELKEMYYILKKEQ